MNEPLNEIEKLLGGRLPDVPAGLRDDVSAAIRAGIRQQTRWDDAKWLGVCLGVLLAVTCGLWLLFQSSDDRLKQFSDSAIVSTEIGKRLPQSTAMPMMASLNLKSRDLAGVKDAGNQ